MTPVPAGHAVPAPPRVARPQRHPELSAGLLVTLGLLAAFAAFALDTYLPAFPLMAADLGTPPAGVQLTLTAFLVGTGAGQLLFGPLSDRYGRRRPLVAGAAVCVAASVVAAVAPTLGVLVAARAVQGLGGAAGVVIGRAVVRDLSGDRAAARAFSVMMLVGGVAPVIAPVAGSLLVDRLHWRGLLLLVAGVAGAMLVSILAVVPESHPADRRVPRAAEAGRARSQLLSLPFVSAAVSLALAFSALMAYIAASPFVFQVVVGLTPVQYAAVFASTAAALTATSALSARLVRRVAPGRLLTAGLATMVAASAAFGAALLAGVPARWYVVPVVLVVASLGLVLGNGTAVALEVVPDAAGTGSAVLGALQFGLGAVVSPLVGLGGDGTAAPLAVVLLVVTSLALLARRACAWSGARSADRPATSEPSPTGA